MATINPVEWCFEQIASDPSVHPDVAAYFRWSRGDGRADIVGSRRWWEIRDEESGPDLPEEDDDPAEGEEE